MRSSQAAIDLIVAEEVTNKATYTKKYQRPEWPGGQSGVTIGIGYDCGFSSPNKIRADWSPYLADSAIAALVRVSGLTGNAARAALARTRAEVSVPWDAAMAVFENNDIPRWENIVLKALPKSASLPPDCFGVLVSLAYNRGPSFNKAGDRYAEMRAIRDHLNAGKLSLIPGDLKSMARLWPNMAGLRARRAREAVLFQNGLKTMAAKGVGLLDEDQDDGEGAGDMSARAGNETGDDYSTINDYTGVTPAGNSDDAGPDQGVDTDEAQDDDAVSATVPTVAHTAPPNKVEVEAVKKRLAALGYNEFGMLNGDFGGRTVGAIAAFKLDRGLNGPATIDVQLKSELDKAESEGWHRPIADARKNATAADIQETVPGVKQNWWQKLIAYIMGLPAAAVALFHDWFGDSADPHSYLGMAKNFLSGLPIEVYAAIGIAIAGLIFYKAKQAQDATVQAFREGKIN